MDRGSVPKAKFKFVGNLLPRALFHAGSASITKVFVYISGFLADDDFEITYNPRHIFYFCIGEECDVFMASNGHRFGCEYSSRTVEGGEGFVNLGHVAADPQLFFDQVNMFARVRNPQSSFYTCDPRTNNEGGLLHI